MPGPASHASNGNAPSVHPFSSGWPHKRLMLLLLKMDEDMPLHHMTLRLHVSNASSQAHHILTFEAHLHSLHAIPEKEDRHRSRGINMQVPRVAYLNGLPSRS